MDASASGVTLLDKSLSLENPKAGSHLVPLAACLSVTSGRVLEIGSGEWSTPFLRRYCLAAKREFLSLEDNQACAERYQSRFVDYNDVLPNMANEKWSVVLVDHWPPKRRLSDAALFSDAEYVLVHDAKDTLARYGKPVLRPGATTRIEYDTVVIRRDPS
jgi:hypothetical protein